MMEYRLVPDTLSILASVFLIIVFSKIIRLSSYYRRNYYELTLSGPDNSISS